MKKQNVQNKKKIILIEDDQNFATDAKSMLQEDYEVFWAEDAQDAMIEINQQIPDLILLDFDLPNISGLEFLKILKPRFPDLPIIMLTGHNEPEIIIECMQSGASDYVIKGQTELKVNLKFRIAKALERLDILNKNQKLQNKIFDELKKYEILGVSKETLKLKSDILKLKNTSLYVTITGENGTGKELVARSLNLQEDEPSRPFIAVNCAGIAANLFESEFFGHVKGAFTGANENKIGKFEAANGGDIFLDEIGEIPLDMQAKLLRVLQEKNITKVGSTNSIPINIRVIAATNRNLEEEVKSGRFREDLYYRLYQISLQVTPLRKRPEDIEFLANHFLKKLLPMAYFSGESLETIKNHDWPGNIRELQNTVERACVFSKDSRFPIIKSEYLMISSLKSSDLGKNQIPNNILPTLKDDITEESFKQSLNWMEGTYLDKALKILKGDNKALYEKLNISKAHYFRRKKSVSGIELESKE